MEFRAASAIAAAALFVLSVPLMLWVAGRRRRPAVRFSSVAIAGSLRPTWRVRLRHIPLALRIAALGFLLFGLAGPRRGDESKHSYTEGVAIQMVLDRSTSMSEPMIDPGRRTVATRLNIVKKVFSEFVQRRPSDVIGLTTFARFVEENCPLTLDHDNLTAFVKEIRYASPIEDGTAIGDALLHAVLTLSRADDIFRTAGPGGQEFTIRSKIIICLTDGQQNAGRALPRDAAEMAQAQGIKVYTIAVVPDRRDARRSAFPSLLDSGLDTRAIEEAAEMTGGEFALATDAASLGQVYDKIDRLERTRFETRFLGYRELFQRWWIVPLGLSLLVGEMVVSNTVWRRLP